MTAATGSPAQDAAAGAGSTSGTGAAASGSGAGSAAGASGSQDSGSGDYLDRVRSGGEFAAQEVRSHQSRADKAEAKLNSMEWIGSLEEQRGTLTGDDILSHLSDYNNLLQDPGMKAAIERFRSGGSSTGTPPASDDTDDEYLTDEQRELKQLRTELGEVKSRVGRTELTDGLQSLKTHMEEIRKKYHLPAEAFTKGSQATAKQIMAWRSMGKTGEKAIDSLSTPSGQAVVEGIFLPAIGPEGLLQAQQNRDRRRSEGLSELETDGLPEHASSGREPPPEFKGPNAAIDAAEWARKNPDAHDSY